MSPNKDEETDEENDMTSFRKIKIYPTIDDINRKEVPKLKPNLISEAYNNSDHYFKTQFHLLREELVRPLIESVAKVRQLAQDEENNGNRSKSFKQLLENQTDFNVYTGIHALKVDVNHDFGLVLTVNFDHELLELVDWTESERLPPGSLLCLSSDKFEKSIVFGIIANRKLNETDQNTDQKLWQLTLQLDIGRNNCNELLEFIMNPNVEYIGIESLTYFEGMRHSLSRLQEANGNFPLKRYIVDMNTDIKPPPYLDEETHYDLSCIARQPKESDETINSGTDKNPLSSIQILKNDYNMMSLLKNSSTFDIKQFEAFHAALTKQFAVIQGPPGTGKTFVGLKIVNCLLDNRSVWAENQKLCPILIVCYKNHALDQFLEAILKFTRNVTRIGGQCTSEALQRFKLSQIRSKVIDKFYQQKTARFDGIPESNRLDPQIIKVLNKIRKMSRRIKFLRQELEEMFKQVEFSFKNVMDFEDIEPYIKPKRLINQLLTDDNLTDDQNLINWLNTDRVNYFDKVIEQQLSKRKLNLERFDEIIDVKDINSLDGKKRWTLYLYWREKYLSAMKKKITERSETIKKEIENLKPKRVELNKLLCKDSLIIGLTITGAAKHRDLVEALNPKIMIVEEAAEVLEGHVMAAISSKIEHLILIGDHQQLRPITNVRELTDVYKLDISLFERMVINRMDFKQLTLQHRMRPSISELLKVAQIYGELRNDVKVTKYPRIKFTFSKDVYFLHHDNIEDGNNTREVVDKSRSNLYEAKFVVELVKYFLLHKYSPEKITVLTTYNAQLKLIKSLMREQSEIFVKVEPENGVSVPEGSLNQEEKEDELVVRVSSVDGFQGEENDIIIISFVRSSKKDSIGFLGNKNRICVALSRARHGLFCVGNFKNMAKQSETWRRIVGHLKNNEFFGDELIVGCNCGGEQSISMPNQFELYNLRVKNRGECPCLKSNEVVEE